MAKASIPHNFTFSVFTCLAQWVFIFRRMPVRALLAIQPYLFKSLAGEAYPSDTLSIELPSDDGESLPARQTFPP